MRRASSLLLTLGLTVGLALGLVAGGASVATAHDVLTRTNPTDGAAVDRLPQNVELAFAEAPVALGTQVIVRGPSGVVSEGTPTITGSVVSQRLAATAPAGEYTVTYRVTSGDGHPVSGTFAFHATVGLDGSTATAAPTVHVRTADPVAADVADSPASSSLVPVLLTVVATCVLLAVGGFLVLRRRPDRQD